MKILELQILTIFDIRMNSEELRRIWRELYEIGDTVIVEADSNNVKLSVNGEGVKGSVLITDVEKSDDQTSDIVEEKVELSFPLRSLNIFNKAALSQNLILSMSLDAPLLLNYTIQKIGSLKIYL